MDKYERVFKAYDEFKDAVCSLSKNEVETLILGIELAIWEDKVAKLEKEKEKGETNE